MTAQKKTVAVFFGGCSTEYEVSLQSAYAIIKSIDTEKYCLVLIGIERGTGSWFWYQGDPDKIREDRWREDGTVQGVLELMGVRVIGCGVLSSALCMDKELAHRVVSAAGIKTAKARVLQTGCTDDELYKAAERVGYPLFVKPLRAGSSFGITKVSEERELLGAAEEAFRHDETVIFERAVDGFEVGCAVLGTKELFIGEVDEIELSEGFFDYTEKYTLKTSKIHVPARISGETAEEIKETALKIYRLLDCSGFSRVDMFLTPSGEIYFNEVNTIPGFTSHSRYPNMLRAAGMTFEEIVEKLLGTED